MIIHFEHPGEKRLKVCGPAFKGWGIEGGLSAKLTFCSTPAEVISHFDWQCLYKCSPLFSGLPPHACSTGMFLPAWKLCCDLSLGRRCRRAMSVLSFFPWNKNTTVAEFYNLRWRTMHKEHLFQSTDMLVCNFPTPRPHWL